MPYTRITITAPGSARHSNVVNFGIGIKNIIDWVPGLIAWEFRVYCWAPDQMAENQVLYDQVVINVGAIKIYTLSFFMPNKDAEITVVTQHLWLDPLGWPWDNTAREIVSLAVAPPLPQFRGFALTEYTRR